ncbi:hypothetical protein GBAR_LOCUS8406 [Geodia barretti]|uniref:Uncharacterized protein n=1 Tax=Geodia barretti TaxID=519541 RepID=A0AA35RM16_GEOBA|nr:hypothetical protein GBAR_LOCUS8406 [Geodia barretti]
MQIRPTWLPCKKSLIRRNIRAGNVKKSSTPLHQTLVGRPTNS